uniref:Titin n=1 Tax=Chelydra serpentina TaxID=8475 RepID=A0A8C3S4V6_CHESE
AAEFITRPQNVEVLEGEKAEFVCSISKDGFEVQWLRGNKVLEAGDKYDIISDGKKRLLVIKDSILGDEGKYSIMVGGIKATAHLKVIGKLLFILVSHILFFILTEEDLRIVVPLEDIETMEKKSVTFWCKVNRLNVTLQWTKNGEEVTFDRRILYKVDKYKHSLIIKDCGFIDEGEYTVTAGQDKSVAELLITEAPADFIEHLQDQTVTEFDDAVFTCQLSKEKASVKWYKNGREIREGKKYLFEKDGNLHRLIIKDCRLEDECEYSCGVDDRKSRARLFVEGKCKIKKEFLPVLRKVHRLQVCEIRPRDQGEYRFIAKDKEARAKLELAVGPTMDLSAFKDGLEVIVPEPLKIRVPITGYPVPTATWSVGDKILEKGDRVKIETTAAFAELVITPSERPDKGIYTLKLENPVSSVSGEIDVNVIARPSAPRELKVIDMSRNTVQLTWEAPENDGGSPVTGYLIEKRDIKFTVPDLIQGKEYLFRVSARNKCGPGESSISLIFIAVPDPPENVKWRDPTSKSIFLAWDPPKYDGGSRIKGYLVEKCQRGTDKWEPCALKSEGMPEPRITWTKADKILKPDDRITIETKPNHSRVTITDSKRTDSGTYIIEAVNSSGRPGPPAAFDISDITNESCFLTWNPPRDDDGGSPITNYIVEKRDVRRKGWQTVDTTVKDTKYTVTPLTEGSLYVFRVAAENAVGQSDYYISENVVVKDPDCKNIFLFKRIYIVVIEGEKLSIPVPFRAVPSPTITWHKGGKEVKAGDRTTMKSDYTSALLEVTNSVHADAGVYTITLENKLGSTTGSVNVKVIGN